MTAVIITINYDDGDGGHVRNRIMILLPTSYPLTLLPQ